MKTLKEMLWVWVSLVLLTIFAYGESGDRVPVRMPPVPSIEPLTKKAKQAAALRQAAEMMENEARKDLEILGQSISNKVSKLDYSSERFLVTVKSVSFMEVGTNYLVQINFDYKEKE